MGTIRIEQYSSVGSQANKDAPVASLGSLISTTVDSTTSTSAESITLDPNCKLVVIYATEAHRVALANTTGTTYAYLDAASYRDFGVTPGGTLYYRADA